MKRKFSVLLSTLLVFFLFLTACSPSSLFSSAPNTHSQDGSTLEVHFLDVGQADAALLLCGSEAMLIDGGNVSDSRLVAAYLKEHHVSHLDYVVSTHAHEDHVGGLSGALNVASAGTVLSPVKNYDSKAFRDFLKYVKKQGKELSDPNPGDRFSFGSASVQVLAPQEEYENTNDTSIVLKVTHQNISFLFTGDAERASELAILEAGFDLRATVLKVSHHGSESSTSYPFLRAVMPEYSVISVEKDNTYGHPSEAVLSRLRDADSTVYRTDMQGHIVAASDGNTVSFSTEKESPLATNPTVERGQEKAPSYYIGNVKTKALHHPDCPSLPFTVNQTLFNTYEEALDEGYLPHSLCLK